MSGERTYVLGVDVGTGSVRAGVFDLAGRMLARAEHPIRIFRPAEDHVEQSSREIWSAVCASVRSAVRGSGVDPERVAGLSFDATCSLVALDASGNPVTVSLTGSPEQNVVVWMDHRARAEADAINATKHRVLDYVGGALSPEQQPPKLKWLKERLPDAWRRTARTLDLADYLVFEATGEDVRSMCTVVCKWTYMGHEGAGGRWDPSFFDAIGLEDLLPSGRAGHSVRPTGERAGTLTPKAADALGLPETTVVGVGIIDAHAGGVGAAGMSTAAERSEDLDVERVLVLVGGTSSCHMAVAREPRFVPGVWGPYFGAMLPGLWLAEGGQTATGALVDHTVASHAAANELERRASEEGRTVYEVLNLRVAELRRPADTGRDITEDLHVLPDFLGNRSPRADSRARGMISGLTLDRSIDALARLYLATVQAVAYGTRHIVAALEARGYAISRIHACGGGTRNALWLQEHANVTGRQILVAPESDAVLLGTAMLAAVATGAFATLDDAMAEMSPRATAVEPDRSTVGFHDAKYDVFLTMHDHQLDYRRRMAGAER